MSVADAVKAAEVGACFRGRDDVVDRNAEVGFGEFDIDENSAETFVNGKCLVNGVAQARFGLIDPGAGNADAQTLDAGIQTDCQVFGRQFNAGRVALVKTDHFRKNNSAVFSALSDDAGGIQTGGKCDHAPAARSAVSRFNTGDAAESRGLTD